MAGLATFIHYSEQLWLTSVGSSLHGSGRTAQAQPCSLHTSRGFYVTLTRTAGPSGKLSLSASIPAWCYLARVQTLRNLRRVFRDTEAGWNVSYSEPFKLLIVASHEPLLPLYLPFHLYSLPRRAELLSCPPAPHRPPSPRPNDWEAWGAGLGLKSLYSWYLAITPQIAAACRQESLSYTRVPSRPFPHPKELEKHTLHLPYRQRQAWNFPLLETVLDKSHPTLLSFLCLSTSARGLSRSSW